MTNEELIAKLNNELRQVTKERDIYKAVLVGAEYPNMDTLASKDIEFATALGVKVKELTQALINKMNFVKTGLTMIAVQIDNREMVKHLTADLLAKFGVMVVDASDLDEARDRLVEQPDIVKEIVEELRSRKVQQNEAAKKKVN